MPLMSGGALGGAPETAGAVGPLASGAFGFSFAFGAWLCTVAACFCCLVHQRTPRSEPPSPPAAATTAKTTVRQVTEKTRFQPLGSCSDTSSLNLGLLRFAEAPLLVAFVFLASETFLIC